MTVRQHISMSSPDLTADDIAVVNAALSTPIRSIGLQIEAFEQAAARYACAKHAVGVNSGTTRLHLAGGWCTISVRGRMKHGYSAAASSRTSA